MGRAVVGSLSPAVLAFQNCTKLYSSVPINNEGNFRHFVTLAIVFITIVVWYLKKMCLLHLSVLIPRCYLYKEGKVVKKHRLNSSHFNKQVPTYLFINFSGFRKNFDGILYYSTKYGFIKQDYLSILMAMKVISRYTRVQNCTTSVIKCIGCTHARTIHTSCMQTALNCERNFAILQF